MGGRVRHDATLLRPAVAKAATSSVATLIQLAILVGAAHLRLLLRLAWPLGAGGLVALAYAGAQTLRADNGRRRPVRRARRSHRAHDQHDNQVRARSDHGRLAYAAHVVTGLLLTMAATWGGYLVAATP